MVNSRESEKCHDILKLDMNYVVYKKSKVRRDKLAKQQKEKEDRQAKISRGIRSTTAGNMTASS